MSKHHLSPRLLLFSIILCVNNIQSLGEFPNCESITPQMKYDCIFESKEKNPCCYLGYLQHSTQVRSCFQLNYTNADELVQSINKKANSLPSNSGNIQATCGMIFEQCATIEKPSQSFDCNRVKIELPYNCCLIIKPNGKKSCYPVDKNQISTFASIYKDRENFTETPSIICQGTKFNINSIIASYSLFVIIYFLLSI